MATVEIEDFEKFLECPICLEIMKIPIIQCEAGHSMCNVCVNLISQCPVCRGPMSKTRNYSFEQMIESFQKRIKVRKAKPTFQHIRCRYAHRGCARTHLLSDPNKMAPHESVCKYRDIQCEGANFCGWNCNWVGYLQEIEKHYKTQHKKYYVNTDFDSENINDFELNFTDDETDIELVNYNKGQHYFWSKIKTSVAEQKIYFVIQLIGTAAAAKKFTYTMEILNGPNKKLKVTQICENDSKDVNELFLEEKCAVISFKTIKHFLKNRNNFKYIYTIEPAKKNLRK